MAGGEEEGRRREWLIDLPYLRPPLSANQRVHWAVRAKATNDVRQRTAWLIRAARVPRLGRVEIQLGYTPPDRRRRDTDNLVPTLKPVADAVVDAGVVPDDTPDWVTKPEPVIDPPDASNAGLWVRLTELDTGREGRDGANPPRGRGQERRTPPPGVPVHPLRRKARKTAPRGLPPGRYPYNPRKDTP